MTTPTNQQSETELKRCSKCGIPKLSECFGRCASKPDGLQSYCVSCKKEYGQNRLKNPAAKEQARDALKEWRADNHERYIELIERHKKKHPEKVRCWNIFRGAIRRGHIKRQSCVKCGEPNAHGHHNDHLKPLEVVWLCPLHHREHHKNQRKQNVN